MCPIFPEGFPSVEFSDSSSSSSPACVFTSILGSSVAAVVEEVVVEVAEGGGASVDGACWEPWSTLLTEAGVDTWPSAVSEDFWESCDGAERGRLHKPRL